MDALRVFSSTKADAAMSVNQEQLDSKVQRLFSTAQAAAYLGVSSRTIGRLVSTGELNAIRYFKWLRYDRVDLDEFIDRIK